MFNDPAHLIPVTRFLGAGSQPEENDFNYLPVPGHVHCLHTPVLPLEIPAQQAAVACEVLHWLSVALSHYHGDPLNYPRYLLSDEQQVHSGVLDQIVAEGEVSARVVQPYGAVQDGAGAAGSTTAGEIRIQETLFAGIWRVRAYDARQQLLADRLEVCPVPDCVWNQPGVPQPAIADIPVPELLPDMMNGHFIAHEIRARLQENPPQPHVINLTLLPVNDADKHWLDQFLGTGQSAVFSRGYGKCRIVSSQYPGVWRIHYFNDHNTLLQDMIEICRIPEIVLASDDDFTVAKQRVDEVLSWLQRDMQQSAEQRQAGGMAAQPNSPAAEVAGGVDLSALSVWRKSTTASRAADSRLAAEAGKQAVLSAAVSAITSSSTTSSSTTSSSTTSSSTTSSSTTSSSTIPPPLTAAELADNPRMECKICWWIYDPVKGDAIWQIPPGTPFQLLPAHWRCPRCDADKNGFMRLSQHSDRCQGGC